MIQQHPGRRLVRLTLNTSSHSCTPPIQLFVPPRVLPFLRLLIPDHPSSTVNPLLILPPSSAPLHMPVSPYWMPLAGSSGLISPNSILVRMVRARRPNSSSMFSPDRAETSQDTGMPCLEAHVDASCGDTSLPSAADVAVLCVPRPNPLEELNDPCADGGGPDLLLSKLAAPGVGGSGASAGSEISDLLPASRTVSCGDASAFASFKKVGNARKELWDVMS